MPQPLLWLIKEDINFGRAKTRPTAMVESFHLLMNKNFNRFYFVRRRSRNRRSHFNMKLKFWFSVTFLMYRIGAFQAAAHCQPKEKSIGGMFLRGYTFKTCNVELPECFIRCDEEVTCQSFNFVIGQKVCEMNNRTKEARPGDFMSDPTRFYMKRANNRGALVFFSFTN